MGGQGALFDSAELRSDPSRTDQPVDGVVVRVVPDVRGMRQELDYVVPSPDHALVEVGMLVDIELAGRRLRAWVVAVGVDPPDGVTIRPVVRLRSVGPAPEIAELTAWGAWRFAGSRSALLATASSPVLVRPSPRGDAPVTQAARRGVSPADVAALGLDGADLFQPGVSVIRMPPAADPAPLVLAAAHRGPTLVITPGQRQASRLAARLGRSGLGAVGLPSGWSAARTGGVSVVGTRVAAWAPCDPLSAVVVLDEHDEALAQEHTPTWHARTVAIERARQAGVPCLLVSPCPSLEALGAGRVLAPGRATERSGWPIVDVVDQRFADPLLPGLVSEPLLNVLRSGARVVCVLNRTGRARLLACDGCGNLARCEACGAAVGQDPSGQLVCGACRAVRPVVCDSCGRTRLRNVRRGVTRIREDLEALIGEPVSELTAAGSSGGDDTMTRVVVGTTAAIHRIDHADAVAFLDFDQELTAPRYRAGEQALALLARAGRLVAPRSAPSPGRVLVQTTVPDHPAVVAAVTGDPARFAEGEATRRADLGWPPARAVALVSHAAAPTFVTGLDTSGVIEVLGPVDDRWMVRAPDHPTLCDALAAAPRPPGRLRIEVDPLHL